MFLLDVILLKYLETPGFFRFTKTSPVAGFVGDRVVPDKISGIGCLGEEKEEKVAWQRNAWLKTIP